MCGRYASARKAEDLAESFGIRPEAVLGRTDPDFNVAPTKPVHVVVERAPRSPDRQPTGDPVRQLRVAQWGLVPSWAKDPSIGNRLINARVETVADKPAFRRAVRARRCLLPADGYYEWWPADGPDGKPVKQPYFIRPRGGGLLALAGLYEFWHDDTKADDDPEAWLLTATVLTTSATDELGRIHDRMPLMVEPAQWADWLDPGRTDPSTLPPLLRPAIPGELEAYAVSRRVNDVRNEGEELIDPVTRADVPPELPVAL
jgi:putative SOS response-associated peptidase YedK